MREIHINRFPQWAPSLKSTLEWNNNSGWKFNSHLRGPWCKPSACLLTLFTKVELVILENLQSIHPTPSPACEDWVYVQGAPEGRSVSDWQLQMWKNVINIILEMSCSYRRKWRLEVWYSCNRNPMYVIIKFIHPSSIPLILLRVSWERWGAPWTLGKGR